MRYPPVIATMLCNQLVPGINNLFTAFLMGNPDFHDHTFNLIMTLINFTTGSIVATACCSFEDITSEELDFAKIQMLQVIFHNFSDASPSLQALLMPDLKNDAVVEPNTSILQKFLELLNGYPEYLLVAVEAPFTDMDNSDLVITRDSLYTQIVSSIVVLANFLSASQFLTWEYCMLEFLLSTKAKISWILVVDSWGCIANFIDQQTLYKQVSALGELVRTTYRYILCDLNMLLTNAILGFPSSLEQYKLYSLSLLD
jgi:hypothetical protein